MSSADSPPESGDFFQPVKKLCVRAPPGEGPSGRPLTSFLIKDILRHSPSRRPSIVRPWDACSASRRPRSADDDSRSESDSPGSPPPPNNSPLDALFEMTSKAFEGLEASDRAGGDVSADPLSLFAHRQQPKKKRKSRTAFTNHQIFELEKRFLYQKYLSPADRDEIAQSLGLTNAQVITWFQNRRAKLKRDMEELKKDVTAASKVQCIQPHLLQSKDLHED